MVVHKMVATSAKTLKVMNSVYDKIIGKAQCSSSQDAGSAIAIKQSKYPVPKDDCSSRCDCFTPNFLFSLPCFVVTR